MARKTDTIKYLGVTWAVIGLTLVFVLAIIRLAPHAAEAFRSGLSLGTWVILLSWCSFMLITEGYMGFQKQFSPRFAARGLYLFNNPRLLHLILAPLFCIGYIHSTKKLKATVWLLSLGILVMVVGVKHVAQPWRGIIDAGVILGLAYGLATVYVSCLRVMLTKIYEVDPGVK